MKFVEFINRFDFLGFRRQSYGSDFPGETFGVLKEKETAKFGEYRTRRLVLEGGDKIR
jgi:hypothetical protein